jgi:hypothetical protein
MLKAKVNKHIQPIRRIRRTRQNLKKHPNLGVILLKFYFPSSLSKRILHCSPFETRKAAENLCSKISKQAEDRLPCTQVILKATTATALSVFVVHDKPYQNQLLAAIAEFHIHPCPLPTLLDGRVPIVDRIISDNPV